MSPAIFARPTPLSAARILAVALVARGLLAPAVDAPNPPAPAPCRLEVVDRSNGWPVPLVQFRTTHALTFVTDNAGVIALDAPELMGRDVWFDILGHGYGVKPDGFGMRGVRLHPKPGATLRVQLERTFPAKRLGRITGAGLFAETQKLGRAADERESGVFGADSVQNAVHRGRMFWVWGDTTLPGYPLGIFDASCATTDITPLGSFAPPLRLGLDYFRDAQGQPRGVARMPGSGPTWLSALVSLPDRQGAPRLGASYVKIRNHLEAYEWGLCVWNDSLSRFERHRVLWSKTEQSPKAPPAPDGHPAPWTDVDGQSWMLFGNPLPNLRCPATFEAWQDPTTWQPLTPQPALAAGDGARVVPHSGSIAWNAFRHRWVTVFMEKQGKPSAFGEVWYAEAPAPTGPWGNAVKVLTHENYTFYNPRLHPEFTPTNSPILLFEGTYSAEFADHPVPTARHTYNQVLYRLDLDDPALQPAHSKTP